MGDKTAARRRMQAAGVPIVPGTTKPLGSVVEASSEAARLGYPVLLKAAAGGGGKGMRLVREQRELASAFEAARSGALKAFGADEDASSRCSRTSRIPFPPPRSEEHT